MWESHQGLARLRTGNGRNGEILERPELCVLLLRELSWPQSRPPAFLGPVESGKWWLVPFRYNLLVPDILQVPGFQGFCGINDFPPDAGELHQAYRLWTGETEDNQGYCFLAGCKIKDTAAWKRAEFTLHIVDHHDYFALLILHKPTGSTWYIDSEPGLPLDDPARPALRSVRAVAAERAYRRLQELLEASVQQDSPEPHPHRRGFCPVRTHELPRKTSPMSSLVPQRPLACSSSSARR